MLRDKSDKAFLYFSEILRNKLTYVPIMINKINPFEDQKNIDRIVGPMGTASLHQLIKILNKGIQSFRSDE